MLALVAASDAALCAALRDAVRAAGHTAVTARDGGSAWAAYEAHRPPLVIVDLGLAPGGAEAPGGGPDGGEAGAGAAPDAPPDAPPDAITLCRRVHAAAQERAPALLPAASGAEDAADDVLGPFVLVTLPREGTADLEGALAAGADDYLTTPLSVRGTAARLAIAARRMREAAAAKRAERALLRTQWLAGIGETSIALQHEINNPLAALLGHAALIEQGLVEPGEERELLDVVVEQAQRIATVMKRLAALRDPRSVEYLGAARMLDLSRPAGGRAAGGPEPSAPAPEG